MRQPIRHPEELWRDDVCRGEREWRDLFAAVSLRGQGRFASEPLLSGHFAVDRVLEAIAAETAAHPAHARDRHRQDVHRVSDCVETFSRALEPEPRTGRAVRAFCFLADRNILANQAYNAFSAFPEDALVRIEPADIRKKGKVPKNGSLFFTIFQTFMSGPPKDGEPVALLRRIPVRIFSTSSSSTSAIAAARTTKATGARILEYFAPAVQLGLTATPKRKDNVDTYKYFGEPVFVYSLKEGINDGFLTPFKVKQISTTLDDYVYTQDDDVVAGQVEEGKRYGEADFNRIIEIMAREKKRVEVFMGQIDQREKTLVFCASQDHALAVRDLINQMKTSADPNYCQRVTANDGALGEQHLRDFQDNEKNSPVILTTSQKLSTGVDARNIRNIVLMRPIGSMIEFKQIIGRGTRLYDGKDYFTIYDFVKAHHHFSDPEWDGEPIEPEPKGSRLPPGPPPSDPGPTPPPPREKIKITLAPGKELTIQHMMATTFWSPDGTPMSAEQFLRNLYGQLPDFFKDEAELRQLWSDPGTRKALLDGLGEKGFGRGPLIEIQRVIDLEKSDLFDVLALLAFQLKPVTREQRAENAKVEISTHFNPKQRVFLEFVLAQYVKVGVDELAAEKLPPLLKLKYNNAIADAIADLGKPEEISKVFAGFQKYLYDEDVA